MEPSNSETKLNVLVVDDNDCVRKALTTLLSQRGHRCESASNGNEAIEKVKESNFDAVITDPQMSEIDGFVLTRELNQHFSDLPVIIMTGQPDESLVESAISAGQREVLRKKLIGRDKASRTPTLLERPFRALFGKEPYDDPPTVEDTSVRGDAVIRNPSPEGSDSCSVPGSDSQQMKETNGNHLRNLLKTKVLHNYSLLLSLSKKHVETLIRFLNRRGRLHPPSLPMENPNG